MYAWSRTGVDCKVDGDAGDVDVSEFTGISIDCAVTALSGGTAPGITFAIDRKNPDGTYFQLIVGTNQTGIAGLFPSKFSLGPGMATPGIVGKIIRVRWVVTGAPTTCNVSFFMHGLAEY
jgi:hypothetical protein